MKNINVVDENGQVFSARFDEKKLRGIITNPMDVEGVPEAVLEGATTFYMYDSTLRSPKKFLITGEVEAPNITEYIFPTRREFVAEDFQKDKRVDIEASTPWEAARYITPWYNVGDKISVSRNGLLYTYLYVSKGESLEDRVLEFVEAYPHAYS